MTIHTPGHSFLTQWVDTSRPVDPGWTPTDEAVIHMDRLEDLFLATRHALSMKRRLGGDATKEELAGDKKMLRKVNNLAQQQLKRWNQRAAIEANHDQNPTDEQRKMGAQFNWDTYVSEMIPYLGDAMRRIATNAMANGYRKDGNRQTHQLGIEYAEMMRIQGDLVELGIVKPTASTIDEQIPVETPETLEDE